MRRKNSGRRGKNKISRGCRRWKEKIKKKSECGRRRMRDRDPRETEKQRRK